MSSDSSKKYLDYLCCPSCKSNLYFLGNNLICESCQTTYEVADGIVKITSIFSKDIELSIEKWDEIYMKQLHSGDFYKAFNEYRQKYFNSVYNQIFSEKKLDKNSVYLEIGCGTFFFGQAIAEKVGIIIGMDFCSSALKIAKKLLDEKGVTNYLLIQGDILKMPLKNSSVDFIYGGGVIEHFKNTQSCIDKLFIVLKEKGVVMNSVPYLNISSLTYRQLWGNIPNIIILKQIAEFVHIKLLKGKHMIFGYELSFLGKTLRKMHKRAGFKKIVVSKFEIELRLDSTPNFLKKPLIWLAGSCRFFWPMIERLASNNRFFWSMIKVVAQKG